MKVTFQIDTIRVKLINEILVSNFLRNNYQSGGIIGERLFSKSVSI